MEKETSFEPSLEQIASENIPDLKTEKSSHKDSLLSRFKFGRSDNSVDAGKPYIATLRFGEVLQAFLEEGTAKGVTKRTGISGYLLQKYFFSNPEFCKLLRNSNEAIFLEATREIRDTQKGFLQKAQQLAEDALDEMERLLNESPSEHVRFKVAQDLLDRDPRISRTKRIEGAGLKVQIDVKTLSVAAVAAREISESPRPEGFVLSKTEKTETKSESLEEDSA